MFANLSFVFTIKMYDVVVLYNCNDTVLVISGK